MADMTVGRHKTYTNMIGTWEYLRTMYEGGREMGRKIMHRYSLEGDTSFNDRCARAVDYRNYCEFIIGIYASNLMEKPPVREGLSSGANEVALNVDGQGAPINTFMRRAIVGAMVEGTRHILVDMPRVSSELAASVVTKAQLDSLNLRPYLVSLPPQDVVNWEFDDRGALLWAVTRDPSPTYGDPIEKKDKKGVSFRDYHIWYRDRWELWREYESGGVEMIDSSPHPMGEVPIVTLYDSKIGPMVGDGSIRHIAPLAEKLFNKISLQDEAEYNSGIPIFAVFSKVPTLDKLGLGTNRGIKLEMGEDAKYIYLPPESIEALRRTCDDLRRDILQLATRQIHLRGESGQVESADKLVIDRHELSSALVDKAFACVEAESRIWRLVERGLSQGSSDGGGKAIIKYNTEFSYETINSQLAASLNIRDLNIPSGTFNRKYLSQLAKRILGTVTDADMQQIEKEIKEAMDRAEKDGGADLARAKMYAEQAMSLIRQAELRSSGNGKG